MEFCEHKFNLQGHTIILSVTLKMYPTPLEVKNEMSKLSLKSSDNAAATCFD